MLKLLGVDNVLALVLHAEDRGENQHSPALTELKPGEKDMKADI